MSVLAKAGDGALERAWSKLSNPPRYSFLRPPETGLVMVRGRAGGTGRAFNMGEMSVTRCAVRLDDGRVGLSYVVGRSQRHAELAAAFDALLQLPERREALDETVIRPLEETQQRRQNDIASNAAGSRVEFFTMVRGEDRP